MSNLYKYTYELTSNASMFFTLFQAGLNGEKLQVFTEQGAQKVQWTKATGKGRALTWYKVTFPTWSHFIPTNSEPWGFHFASVTADNFWCSSRRRPLCYPNDRYGQGNDLGEWYKHRASLDVLPLSSWTTYSNRVSKYTWYILEQMLHCHIILGENMINGLMIDQVPHP